MAKTIDISRAEYAYKKVSEVIKEDEKKKYLSLVRSFPILIHNNGYATATALLYSKKEGNKEYKLLYEHISNWLLKPNIKGKEDLMELIIKKSNEDYKRLSNETMALLIWLKRFAEGMISDDTKNSTEKQA